MAGGAVGVAAGPVIVGGALVGAGTVLALKGLGVPVDEVAARAAKTAKAAAAKAAPVVRKRVVEGASAVGDAIASSAPIVGKRVATGAAAAGAGIRRAIGHRKPDMQSAVSPHDRRQLHETQQGHCNGWPQQVPGERSSPGPHQAALQRRQQQDLQPPVAVPQLQQHQGQPVNGLPARPPERDLTVRPYGTL